MTLRVREAYTLHDNQEKNDDQLSDLIVVVPSQILEPLTIIALKHNTFIINFELQFNQAVYHLAYLKF